MPSLNPLDCFPRERTAILSLHPPPASRPPRPFGTYLSQAARRPESTHGDHSRSSRSSEAVLQLDVRHRFFAQREQDRMNSSRCAFLVSLSSFSLPVSLRPFSRVLVPATLIMNETISPFRRIGTRELLHRTYLHVACSRDMYAERHTGFPCNTNGTHTQGKGRQSCPVILK